MQGPALHRIVGMLLLALAVPLLAWQSTPSHQLPIPHADFLALHSLLEIFAVAVAALVFFVGMGTTGAERSTRAMLLGGAFLAVALFDAQHLLSYAGMPDVVSANSPHKSILFWLLSRYGSGCWATCCSRSARCRSRGCGGRAGTPGSCCWCCVHRGSR